MKKVLSCLLLAVTVFVIASCGANTVKVEDYIDLGYYSTYNGYAEPYLIIDYDELDNLMDDTKTINYMKSLAKANGELLGISDKLMGNLYKNNPESIPGFSYFFDINLVEDYQNLKNGDKIKAKITLDSRIATSKDASVKSVAKKLGISLSKDEIEFTVEGLEEIKIVDVDYDKLLNVSYSKYNGYASASVSVDYDYLQGLYINEVLDDFASKTQNSDVSNRLYWGCDNWFTVEIEGDNNNLKNGDTIKVNLVLDKTFTDNGISIKDLENGLAVNLNGGSKEYVVEGLEDPQNVLDIFEGIEQYIVYTGASGNASASKVQIPDDYSKQIGNLYFSKGSRYNSVKVVHNNTRVGDITYYVDGDNLSIGDTIGMEAYCPTDELENLGYYVPYIKKDITVPNIGEYMRKKEQLTPEATVAIKNYIYENTDESEIDMLYFATYKPGIECNYDSTSFITAIYYETGWYSGYHICELNDIIIKPNGEIIVEDFNRNRYTYYETLEEAISSLDGASYDFVVLG